MYIYNMCMYIMHVFVVWVRRLGSLLILNMLRVPSLGNSRAFLQGVGALWSCFCDVTKSDRLFNGPKMRSTCFPWPGEPLELKAETRAPATAPAAGPAAAPAAAPAADAEAGKLLPWSGLRCVN